MRKEMKGNSILWMKIETLYQCVEQEMKKKPRLHIGRNLGIDNISWALNFYKKKKTKENI